jgi:hypothetical protein
VRPGGWLADPSGSSWDPVLSADARSIDDTGGEDGQPDRKHQCPE